MLNTLLPYTLTNLLTDTTNNFSNYNIATKRIDNNYYIKYFFPFITKEDIKAELYNNILIVKVKYKDNYYLIDKRYITDYELKEATHINDVLTIQLIPKESTSITIN